IPDRNDPFARPGPVLAEMAGGLQGAGAQVLAIACDTAHVHADLISRASGLPLVDMIETASRAARDSGARRAGVLGARDAVRLYHEYIAAQGMGLVTLPRDDQARFMDLVGRIKAGDLGAAVREGMRQLAEVLVREGAEAVIAGCTEVPLVLDPGDVRAPLIDAGEELARRCVSVCLGLEPLPQGR
ncbi:MAG: amino acid racemase, partial [Phenylobacterium sp.]|nr:amino acid racemase [Phenylobacterium sp.]